jgi:hypothetical protein
MWECTWTDLKVETKIYDLIYLRDQNLLKNLLELKIKFGAMFNRAIMNNGVNGVK